MAVGKQPRPGLEEQLENDHRDVADLWKEAIKSYTGIVGFDLERKFDNANTMLNYGTDQMNRFHKFRHDKGKVDRLRTLFASNLDLIEQGAGQLIGAATPAFPPAAAIGTALTYLLQACRSVSADYDIVIVFFDDMNSFLSRITILETRLPQKKAYQNCLMEVFTSLLTLCGFAHKYIELGRFKKWISNLFQGDDGDLSGARSKLDKRLEHLQEATEFAILGNTEETLKMTSQLEENQQSHAEMLEQVGAAIHTIHENTESIKDDVAKLLKLFGGPKKDSQQSKAETSTSPSAIGVRHAMPLITNDDHEYKVLKETLLPDSCTWVFLEPEWEEWLAIEHGKRPILAITASPGAGKSHVAAVVHDRLVQRTTSGEDADFNIVTHFYFREEEDTFSVFFCGIITIVNQIAERNPVACEKLNTQIAKDEVPMLKTIRWQDTATHLLGAIFGEHSKFHLFIVFDGLDELLDWPNFKEFVSDYIIKQKLRISLVVTSRPERLDDLPQEAQLVKIEATKDKQRQDLKALIWNRINTVNHLRGFSRYVKQRIADKVEEDSPNMLYADHLLTRLDDKGREGAVIRALEEKKPEGLHGIYEILLSECQRRMPSHYQEIGSFLLHWIAFSKRSLELNAAQSLVKYLANDQNFTLEEIPEVCSKFLKIGEVGINAELRAKSAASSMTAIEDWKRDADDYSEDAIYDDGPLAVKFRERSMRHYFTNKSYGASAFRWGPSESNRKIFLTCTKLVQSSRTDIHPSLSKYCALLLLPHWYDIQIDQHTPQEQIEVLEATAEAISNKTGYAEMLRKAGMTYMKGANKLTDSRAVEWAKLLENEEIKQALSGFAVEWWQRVSQDPSKTRLGLAKGFLTQLYEAKNIEDAFEAWNLLSGLLNMVGQGKLLVDQARINFPNQFEEVDTSSTDNEEKKGEADDPKDWDKSHLGILNLFGDEIVPDAGAHRAVSQILMEFGDLEPARKVARMALDICSPSDEEWFKSSCVLSDILLAQQKKKKTKQSYEVASKAVAELPDHAVSPQVKRAVYAARARAQSKLGYLDEALESYAEAKAADPDSITPAAALSGQLKVLHEKADKTAYIRVLKSWTLLEKITWLSSNYEDEAEERHGLLCDIATETGEVEFIIQIYREVIEFLDNLDAGTPFRVDLASIYYEVQRDPQKALETMDLVFDSHTLGFQYPITGAFPTWVLGRAIDIMTNVHMELFRKSRDPAYKLERLEALAGVMERHWPMDIPRVSAFVTTSQRIGLAYMYMVMGPTNKFQEVLQGLLDDGFAGLTDTVGFNDDASVFMICQALALLGRAVGNDQTIRRYSRIIGSALYATLEKSEDSEEEDEVESENKDEQKESHSEAKETKKQDGKDHDDDDDDDDDEEDEDDTDGEEEKPPEDEGDLANDGEAWWTCTGFCVPSRGWKWWGDHPAYLYITFAMSLVCEDCQAEYEAMGRGEGTLKARYFHGIGHDYIKLPIEGWRGVKNGMMRLEGEEPVAFMDFVNKLKDEVVPGAWDRIWAGQM